MCSMVPLACMVVMATHSKTTKRSPFIILFCCSQFLYPMKKYKIEIRKFRNLCQAAQAQNLKKVPKKSLELESRESWTNLNLLQEN